MMKDLKSLIYTRPKASPMTGESSNQGENASTLLTVTDSGYEDSKNANGNPIVLGQCLENVYFGFKERCRKDEYYQKKLKEPHVTEQEKLRTELSKRNTAKEIKEEELAQAKKRITVIDQDILNSKANPEDYGIDAHKRPKAQFYMGLLVLLPITIYLIVFYMSASYSAFFKDFDTSKLSAAIFDAQAFSKAMEEGWLEAIFVSTIPFAFMGLGYLIHMFQKEGGKGTLKIVALFLMTFVFDAILAYLIESKIYEFNKTADSKDFNLSIAFQQVEFWGIIFAGFVVYVIWGLVFDFVMKEFENIDKVNRFITGLREEKKNCISFIKELDEKINAIKLELSEINGRIKELQSTIDSFVFSNRHYLLYYSSYLKGWLLAISKELYIPKDENDKLINACNEVAGKHIEALNIGLEDETKIFNIAV